MHDRGVEQEMEELRQEVERLRERLAALGAGGGTGPEAGETGTERSSFRRTFDEAQERGEQALKDLTEQIKRHPGGSTLTAFGIGLLLARLLGGGRRS